MAASIESIADKIRQHPKLVIAEDFEIAIQRSRGLTTRYQNGDLQTQTETRRLWVSLRIQHRKRGGRATVLNPTEAGLNYLVESAFESAQLSSVDPWFRFPKWRSVTGAPVSCDPGFAPYPSLYGSLPEGCVLLDETYEEALVETYLRRKTERFDLKHAGTSHHGVLGIVAGAPESLVLKKEERQQSHVLQDRLEWMHAVAAAAKLRATTPARVCGKGRRQLILSPQAVAVLLHQLGPCFHADRIQRGRSPLATCLGAQVFGEALTLVDDSSRGDAAATQPFDLEGVPTQRTVLVDKGIVKSWLFDVQSATRENRLSTGNLRRQQGQMHASISSGNLFFEPGTLSRQELLNSVGAGILVDEITQIEPINELGRYRVQGLGWRTALGELQESLVGIEWNLDIGSFWSGAVAAANDLSFESGVGAPTILIADVLLG